MSNLTQFRNAIAIFSVAVIGAVGLTVGGDEDPGLIDAATKSAVARLASHDSGSSQKPGENPAGVALVARDVSSPDIAAKPTTSSNPWAIDKTPKQPVVIEGAPDVGVIHK